MEHTEIAPLAKRLAEENNVNWRRLRGSGERGRIVERDVLEFLARVMAGDEEVDPTPEPLPDGMAAWPDEDVRAFEREQRGEEPPPAGQATVDDEIFLIDGDAGDDLLDATGGNGRALDEDELGDEVGDDLLDTGGEAPLIDADLDEDDLLIAGDEGPGAESAAPAWRDVRGDASPTALGDEDDERVVASGGEQAGHLPDLFDDGPAGDGDALSPVFDDAGLGTRQAFDRGRYSPGPWLEEDHRGAAEPEPAAAGVVLDEDGADEQPGYGTGAVGYGTDEEQEQEQEQEQPATPPGDGDEAVAEAGAADHGDEPAAAGHVHELEPDDGGALEAPPVAAPARLPELPLVQHGAVWRRQVDLTSLVAAQADVASDLGLGAPVPLVAFLARAAAKALPEAGTIAIALVGEDGLRTLAVDTDTRFADLARHAAGGLDGAGDVDGPALIVADLSELDVDEAVLHLGAPVLCLGRVLIDSSTGGRRALLSLSGDGAGRAGGKVLARAADLLETPIRLVL